MDIDYDSIVDFQILKNTSFLNSKVANENRVYHNSIRNSLNESNGADRISFGDFGAFSGCKSKSVTVSKSSDESIVSRDTPLVVKVGCIPFKNITNTVCFILTESNIQIVPPFPEKELLSSENVSTKSQYETNTPNSPPNVMQHSHWSAEMFQTEHIHSGNDVNSLLINQKLMSNQSNAADRMHLAHLGDPGRSSRESVLSENASVSDETIRYGRRSLAMVIDDSDEEMCTMYHKFNHRDISNTTLVNPPPAASIIDYEEITQFQQEQPPGLTKLGMIHWDRDKSLIPDWRNLPKTRKEMSRIKESG